MDLNFTAIETQNADQVAAFSVRRVIILCSNTWHWVFIKEAYSSLCYKHRTATGACVPYGITQSYLRLGRGSTPALTPAVAGEDVSNLLIYI